jgi:putative aldouronate transport system substrate-binding protein
MKKVLSLVLALTMLLCMVSFASAQEVVTLRWVAVGGGMPANYDAWLAKVNPYLAEKIGVNIDMEVVSWGDWGNRRGVIVNTNEPYDIIFGDSGTYNTDVKLGAYLDITDLVATAAPELQKLIPESYWDACRIGGKVYAVPTYKDSSQSQYFVWDQTVLDELKLDASKVHDLKDATPLLTAIKDKKGEASFPLSTSSTASYILFQYDQMNTGLPAIGVRYDDAAAKVVPVYEQADIMESLTTLHDWYKAGIINSDASTLPENTKYRSCAIAQGWSSAAKTTWGPNMGVEAVAYQYKDTIVSNDTVRGSLNSISVNCEHPEKALAFLNLLNTDSWLRDSFYYGVEGDNWQYTDKGRVHKNNSDWTMAGYTQATFFQVTPTDDVEINQWDEVKALNEAAKPSVLLGFTFDTTKVQDQIAACTEINKRYSGEVLTGVTDPTESVPQMMKEMRDAGFDEIVKEAQAQVDAFMAAKK